jgi:TetR/AcrR family transcriptional repressor of nem operon
MGRPYEFNREESLSKAMEIFWEKGYKATSVQDLVDRMGIKRGSIYNTFGDKHSLFIAALEFYAKKINSKRIRVLEETGSPTENIRNFFEAIANIPPEKKTRGCLISNTVVELAPHDAKVAETLRPILRRIQKAFLNCLNKAVEMGELPKDTDTKALASFLATSTHGLIVTGKSAPDPTEVKRVIDVILSTLH